MKEVRLEDVVDEYFETHDTCTFRQLYHFVDDYRKKYDCYVPYDRDEIDYVIYTLGADKYYWDNNAEIIRKQEVIECICCGTKHRKYPDVEKFEKLKNIVIKYYHGSNEV